jgi:lysophospholipase L1-like esterase
MAFGQRWASKVDDGAPTGACVLCYGDSLTAGYVTESPYTHEYKPWAPLVAEALGVRVDHCGMSGWTTQQMLEALDATAAADVCEERRPGLRALLRARAYTHVVLMAGTNDLAFGGQPEEVFARLRALHEACHAAGVERTVALTIPESALSCPSATRFPSARLVERRREANELLKAYAEAAAPRCAFVAMDAEVPWAPESPDWEPDGLHMSEAGYARFGAVLSEKLRAIFQPPD